MTEYILKIEKSKQSAMLVKYLKSLDFVIVEAKQNTQISKRRNTIKPQKEDRFIKFLEALPNVEFTEQEVNESILEMRKGK
jgi:hypothetical protein